MANISLMLDSDESLALRQMILDWSGKNGGPVAGLDRQRAWLSLARQGVFESLVPDSSYDRGLVLGGVVANALGEGGVLGAFAQTAAGVAGLSRLAGTDPRTAEIVEELLSGRAEVAGIPVRGRGGIANPAECLESWAGASTIYVLTTPPDGASILLHRTTAQHRGSPAGVASRLDHYWRSPTASYGEASLLVEGSAARDLLCYLTSVETLLTCAQLVGACRWLITNATEYSRVRVQFGHPIGSFQGLQHVIVEMLALTEGADGVTRSALEQPTERLIEDSPEVVVAAQVTADAAWSTLMKCYEVLGGVGFMEETANNHFMREMTPLIASLGPAADRELEIADSLSEGGWVL